jgi:membrane-anchored protein YejM (alkaline phosphatase superfamily)
LFLKKDIFSLFDDLDSLVYRIYDFVLLLLILVLTFLAGILIFNQLLLLDMQLTSLYYSLVSLGWFSCLFFVAYLLKRPNAFRLLSGMFVAVLIIYYFTFPIIEHSFALK